MQLLLQLLACPLNPAKPSNLLQTSAGPQFKCKFILTAVFNMKHTNKCKLTLQGILQCFRIKFHIFEHIHGVVFPRKLSWKMFSGVLHSLAVHPPDYAGIPVGQEQEWPQFIQVSILITESSAWGLGRRWRVWKQNQNSPRLLTVSKLFRGQWGSFWQWFQLDRRENWIQDILTHWTQK